MPSFVGTLTLRALSIVLMLATAGCATIINGTTQPIAITSSPSGARVIVDDHDTSYTTPANVELERGRDHLLTFHLNGYEDETFMIKHSLSGVVAGNILAGGLIGWGVDAADGAQDKLTPETVQMTLNPLKKNEVPATAGQDVGLGAQFSKLDLMYSQKTITKGEYDAARKRLIDEQLAPSQPTPVQPQAAPNPNVDTALPSQM